MDLPFRDQSDQFEKQSQEPLTPVSMNSLPGSSRAVTVFFEDYVLESRDRHVSRGYLDGLGALLAWAGPESLLAQGVEAVALANLGKKVGDTDMLREAGASYGRSLKGLRAALMGNSHSDESLMTATILGLYEVRLHLF